MSSSSSSSNSRPSQDGIDIRLAMEILSQRQTCHDHHHNHSHNNHSNQQQSDGQLSHAQDVRTWGQHIQMIPSSSTIADYNDTYESTTTTTTVANGTTTGCGCSCPTPSQHEQSIQNGNLTTVCNFTQCNLINNEKADEGKDSSSTVPDVNDNDHVDTQDDDNNDAVLLQKEYNKINQQKDYITTIRNERQIHIQQQINTMSVIHLIQFALETQQQRVIVYKKYNSGLETVLQTRNLTFYPSICTDATASFAVQSDTINSIHTVLQSRWQRTDIATILRRLQNNERDKLNYTAAYHLERIRQQQQQQEQGQQEPNDNNTGIDVHIATTTTTTTTTGAKNGTEQRLLQQGVVSLREKIQTCVDNINDIIDEIQMILLDEQEKEC